MDFGRRARTIVGIGRNYVAHARELKNPLPSEPFWFLKPASSLQTYDADQAHGHGHGHGHGNVVEIADGIGEVHHEVELAVVIGKRASRVTAADAMAHVAGYTVAIDVTGRSLQDKLKETSLPWARAKGYDTWCPVGPFVSRDSVRDPHDLTLFLNVNGEPRQRDSTGLMIFRIPELIEAVTDVMTLDEGDVLLTGTPKGVAQMRPGDVITCGCDGLGIEPLTWNVVARPPRAPP